MPGRLVVRGPRLVVVAASLVALSTATLTLAATKTQVAAKPSATPAVPAPAHLVVPDVRRQAYVFAKAALEEAGFAWKVTGSVQGFAANTVVAQSPAPGVKVVDTGLPTIVLTLARNAEYAQEGTPENVAPYGGDPIKLVGAAPAAKPAPKATPKKAKPAAAPAKQAAKPAAKPAARKPAFAVPGAPAEPLDEPALPQRARTLAAWLETHRTPTDANVNHWLYQHSWIVTGAEFGWSGGADALRTLVAVDRRVQQLWGIGARSEQVAAAAFARVEAKTNAG